MTAGIIRQSLSKDWEAQYDLVLFKVLQSFI